METLNYSTHAIDDLNIWTVVLHEDMPATALNVQRISGLLRRAVKFYLPDNGDLFEDGLRALPSEFRLPYPIIAAEFRITRDAPSHQQPMAVRGEQTFQSSRRIALAIEVTADNFEAFSWMLPRDKHEVLASPGAIAVIPIFYFDQQKQWIIPPYGVAIPVRKTEGSAELLARAQEAYGGDIPRELKRVPLEIKPIRLMPERTDELEATHPLDYILGTAVQDTHDESHAIVSLIEVLSCKNVFTETVHAPAALNKKRESKGKTPLFEYKVLVLDPEEKHTPCLKDTSGTHASPRVHLRRGHIRRLPQRNIWVNAAVVGSRKAGMLMKDYSVVSMTHSNAGDINKDGT